MLFDFFYGHQFTSISDDNVFNRFRNAIGFKDEYILFSYKLQKFLPNF